MYKNAEMASIYLPFQKNTVPKVIAFRYSITIIE